MARNVEARARFDREQFYRSCSQNWLNAMLDVELGVIDENVERIRNKSV